MKLLIVKKIYCLILVSFIWGAMCDECAAESYTNRNHPIPLFEKSLSDRLQVLYSYFHKGARIDITAIDIAEENPLVTQETKSPSLKAFCKRLGFALQKNAVIIPEPFFSANEHVEVVSLQKKVTDIMEVNFQRTIKEGFRLDSYYFHASNLEGCYTRPKKGTGPIVSCREVSKEYIIDSYKKNFLHAKARTKRWIRWVDPFEYQGLRYYRTGEIESGIDGGMLVEYKLKYLDGIIRLDRLMIGYHGSDGILNVTDSTKSGGLVIFERHVLSWDDYITHDKEFRNIYFGVKLFDGGITKQECRFRVATK